MDISNLSATITLNEVAGRLITAEANIIVMKNLLLDNNIVLNADDFDAAVRLESVKLFQELFARNGDIGWNDLLNKNT